MGLIRREAALCFLALLCFWTSANGLLTPKGVNYEGRVKSVDVYPFNFILAFSESTNVSAISLMLFFGFK